MKEKLLEKKGSNGKVIHCAHDFLRYSQKIRFVTNTLQDVYTMIIHYKASALVIQTNLLINKRKTYEARTNLL
jgi:hypothetical protein